MLINRDYYNIIKKTTWLKLANAAKVYSAYFKSKRLGKSTKNGLPIALSLEPTTACNLGCPECPSGLKSFTRPTGNLSFELFQKIIDEIYKELWYLTFYFQGEPYLNRDFLKMVKYASDKGIFTATSTNAHFLDDKRARQTVESGLDRLIVSIDGTTQDTYESYRKGGKLERVIQGTENIIHWRKKLKKTTPSIVFQFLVVGPNEHQIPDVKALAKKMGIDKLALKTAQIYDYEEGSPLIPKNEKYSRYKKQKDGTYTIKNHLEDHCWKMWHSCVITWDGDVVPCCFDKDAHYKMGSLAKDSFAEVWSSEPYEKFRNQVIHARSSVEMCKNCTEGTKVWA